MTSPLRQLRNACWQQVKYANARIDLATRGPIERMLVEDAVLVFWMIATGMSYLASIPEFAYRIARAAVTRR